MGVLVVTGPVAVRSSPYWYTPYLAIAMPITPALSRLHAAIVAA
jgi:hypothetical protein